MTAAESAATAITTRNYPSLPLDGVHKLLDLLLEQHSPKTEPFDHGACRAMECQIVVNGVGALAGPLSETGIPGVYRMTCTVQKAPERKGEPGPITMAEYYFRADDIKTIVFERPDLVELAKKAVSDAAPAEPESRLWTPSSGKKP